MSDEEDSPTYTQDEVEVAVANEIRKVDYPEDTNKMSVFQWFTSINKAKENFKTANLSDAELGMPLHPVRSLLEISHFSQAMGNQGFTDFFKGEAQIIAGTSLSREGFLDNLAVTNKKDITTSSRRRASQQARGIMGLFSKRKPEGEQ